METREVHGMVISSVPEILRQQCLDADLALKRWVQKNYPLGTVLRWKTGKYAGRLCRIVWAVIINEPDTSMTVGLRVETRKASGEGYVSGKDDFHRTFHDAEYFFEPVTDENI